MRRLIKIKADGGFTGTTETCILSPDGNYATDGLSVYITSIDNSGNITKNKLFDLEEEKTNILFYISNNVFASLDSNDFSSLLFTIIDYDNKTTIDKTIKLDEGISYNTILSKGILNIVHNTFKSIEIKFEPVLDKLNRLGSTFYNTSLSTFSSSDLLKGKIGYNSTGKILGTMPNNGELSYTPSDEEQTIPAGYTSGGVVKATNIELLDDYEKCMKLSNMILSKTSPVSYIKYNTPNSYTNLGIQWNNNYKYEIHFDDSIGIKGSDVTLFGNLGSVRGNMFEINNPYRVSDNRQWTNTTQTYKPGQHILTFSTSLGMVMDGIQIQTYTISGSNTMDIWLGKANWSQSSNQSFQGKVFEFIVYDENEEIVFDAVPDPSGTFKDKISNKLLSTSGEVQFGYDEWTGYVLPKLYELEYITNTNGAYIDTGITNIDYCKTELKLQGSNVTNQRIFGFNFDSYHMCWWNNQWYYGSDGTSNTDHTDSSVLTKITDLCEIIYNDEENKVSINGETFGNKLDVVSNSNNRNITIFKEYASSELYYGKLYYFKITNKQTNEVIIDLIPVRTEYGEVCMYDKKAHTLYTSMNNKTFIAGPDIGPLEEV